MKMEIGTILKDILQPLAIIFGGAFALYQYSRQQQFKRLQNLSSLWKNFSSDTELLALFSLMNEIEMGNVALEQQLAGTNAATKLKYLALIEEVSLYIEKFEIDKEYAKYLFQWHFTFAYQSSFTVTGFWANIGGDVEMNASYWSKSKQLSSSFKVV